MSDQELRVYAHVITELRREAKRLEIAGHYVAKNALRMMAKRFEAEAKGERKA